MAPSTRFARLSPLAARLVLAALAWLLAIGVVAALAPRPPLNLVSPDQGDVALYRAIEGRLAPHPTVPDYYRAATAEHRLRRYPLRPAMTVREPALALLTATLGEAGTVRLMQALGIVALAAFAWRLRTSSSAPLPCVPAKAGIQPGLPHSREHTGGATEPRSPAQAGAQLGRLRDEGAVPSRSPLTPANGSAWAASTPYLVQPSPCVPAKAGTQPVLPPSREHTGFGGVLRAPATITAVLLAFLATVAIAGPAMQHWHEAWAGLLVLLSLALRSPGRWRASCAVALLAVLIRELALPYLVVMGMAALVERRRGEAAGWALATLLFALAYAGHILAVSALAGPHDLASPGWAAGAGWGGVVTMAGHCSALMLLPGWVAAVVLPLALLGWAGPATGFHDRALLALFGWVAPFLLIGRADNFYWGLLWAPMALIGLAWAPAALRDLLRAARAPAPTPPLSYTARTG